MKVQNENNLDGIKIKELLEEEFPYIDPEGPNSKSLVTKFNAFQRMISSDMLKEYLSKETESQALSPMSPNSRNTKIISEFDNLKKLTTSHFVAFSKRETKQNLNSVFKRENIYEDFDRGAKLMRKISVAENMHSLEKYSGRKATGDFEESASKESRKILAEEFNAASYLTSRKSISQDPNELIFRFTGRDDKRSRTLLRKASFMPVQEEAQEQEEKQFPAFIEEFIDEYYAISDKAMKKPEVNTECLDNLVFKRQQSFIKAKKSFKMNHTTSSFHIKKSLKESKEKTSRVSTEPMSNY